MDKFKHYIRIDSNNYIIVGFSEAFEKPKSTDICIGEGSRHFQLNGVINPPLFNDNVPLYKWDGQNIVNLTDDDVQNYKSVAVGVQPPSVTDLQIQIFNLTTQLVSLGVI